MTLKSITVSQPPFPRLGEVYRALASALDTKAKNRTVDRLAREGEYDWSLLPTLAQDVFVAPLQKYIDPEFAGVIEQAITHFHSDYLGLVSTISLDSLSRDEALPLLIDHYFSLLGAGLLYGIKKEDGGPDLSVLLDPDYHPIAVVLDWCSGGDDHALVNSAFPGSTGTDRTNREMVRRWANGNHFADLASIKRFCEALAKRGTSEQRENARLLRRWLLVARALAWLEKVSPIPIRASMHRYLLLGLPASDIGHVLSIANHQVGERYLMLKMPALTLYEQIKRATPKQPGDQATAKARLEELQRLTNEHEPEGRTQFHLEWMRGRWHVLSGQFEDAVPYYQRAADLANYRAGEFQKRIVEEALVLAAHVGKKTLLNQLKHRAIAFGLFANPRGDAVIEGWEIDHLCQQFHQVFPLQGRFVEAVQIAGEPGQLPFLALDTEELAHRKPDLGKPDRVVAVRSFDAQVRRWPQLRLFASLGKAKEVAALLGHGASVDQLDEAGGSALLCAIQHAMDTEDRATLDLLLRYSHTKETLNSATKKKQLTVLICAIDYGAPEVVERLLAMGASSDQRGSIDNRTPLHFCLEKLGAIRHPAKLYQRLYRSMPQQQDLVHQDALRRYSVSFAGVFGDEQNLHAVLQDPRKRALFDKVVAAMVNDHLRRFTEPKLIRIAELLLKSGANPNAPHDYPEKGRTPLMLAAESDSVPAFDLMMQYHGNPYQQDASGLDCSQIAIGFGAGEVVGYLRNKGIL
jgi:hypothetical protein